MLKLLRQVIDFWYFQTYNYVFSRKKHGDKRSNCITFISAFEAAFFTPLVRTIYKATGTLYNSSGDRLLWCALYIIICLINCKFYFTLKKIAAIQRECILIRKKWIWHVLLIVVQLGIFYFAMIKGTFY